MGYIDGFEDIMEMETGFFAVHHGAFKDLIRQGA